MSMDRCIVNGCTAGLSNNTKEKQTVATRQNLLFKTPNDPDLLKKWCTALGQKVGAGDKVCEFHFEEGDIFKNLSTFSKVEGQKPLALKKICTLRKGAVPKSSMVRKDPFKIQNPSNQQKEEVAYISEDNEDSRGTDDSIVELVNGENGDFETVEEDAACQQNTVAHQSNSDQDTLEDIIQTECTDDLLQSEPKQSTQVKIVANYTENGIVLKRIGESSQVNNVNNQSQKIYSKRKLNNLPTIQNKFSKSDTSRESFTPLQLETHPRCTYSPVKKLDHIDELKLIVQHRNLRQQWCSKIEKSSVGFSYVDFEKSRINCCLEIAEDFTVKAYTADKIIAIYVTTTDGVSCVNEIIEVMKVLEKKRWCLGPGIPLVNRPPDCIGAMPVKTLTENCAACIKEKLNATAHTRELANCRIKLDELRHKFELMRKKHSYATSQYDRLKAENKILEYQVDEAKKIAINEVLNRLPALQKQVVRYIINSSYTARSAVRYNTAWINECIVIRAMSPAVYEYIRQKDILPLPCPDTLKKHKFKIFLDKDPNASESDDSFDYSTLPESPEIPDPVDAPQSSEIPEFKEIFVPEFKEMQALEPMEIPLSTDMPEITEGAIILDMPDLGESTEIVETMEIPESTGIPESTNADGYTTVLEFIPDCIISDDVAYEVTVSSEAVEEEQY